MGATGAQQVFAEVAGFEPRSLAQVLAAEPSFVQDRWHARLYFLAPVLRLSLAGLWLSSGLVGMALMPAAIDDLMHHSAISEFAATLLLCLAIATDCILGLLALFAWRVVLVGWLMLIALSIYTISIGIMLPDVWLEPFGGLLKNIPLIPAVMAMMVLARRR